jgi:UDP-N-acetylmuramoyl-L-alanyl-D-glutamate--2,6-diaminopimelate ligase
VNVGDVLATLGGITVDAGEVTASALATPISAITYDSRRATGGSVFVALRGMKADGREFASQALSRGAVLVVAETPRPQAVAAPWLVVSDARLAIALLADRFCDHPSRRMKVIGVTGTNGKTTTAYLLASILDAAGVKAGLLGTVTYRLGLEEREASRTTPEAPDVQQLLNEMIRQGCKSAVMEVSSHALALKRVDGMRFTAGIFTNLTRDHLDFHADMETYFQAKRRLFEMLPDDAPGVINLDDPRGPSLLEVCRNPMTFAITRSADVTPGPLEFTLSGLTFELRTPRGTVRIDSKLVGRPNVSNILAAAATAVALGPAAGGDRRRRSQPAGRSRSLRGRLRAGRRSDCCRRLRAHRRCVAQSDGNGETAGAEGAHHGLRLRRGPRQDEAPAHGNGRGTPQRRRHHHLR